MKLTLITWRKRQRFLQQRAKNEKPDANDKIIEGMVRGRINKELKEICLLDQVYVKAEGRKTDSSTVCSRSSQSKRR